MGRDAYRRGTRAEVKMCVTIVQDSLLLRVSTSEEDLVQTRLGSVRDCLGSVRAWRLERSQRIVKDGVEALLGLRIERAITI